MSREKKEASKNFLEHIQPRLSREEGCLAGPTIMRQTSYTCSTSTRAHISTAQQREREQELRGAEEQRMRSTGAARPGGDTPWPREGAVATLCWSSQGEIPHVQGKRNPSKTVGVARGHQRADRLKPQSQTTSQSDHRTTVLSNSLKLSHAVGPPKTDGSWWRGLTECGPLEKGIANHFSILALRTP